MELLVLGGTRFVGRAFVDAGLARGDRVTVFNRGTRRAPDGVVQLHGDRTARDGLGVLAYGRWDVVVDTWSGAPSAVRDAADLLTSRADRLVLVSSRSVYTFPLPPGADEQAPVVEASPDDGDDVDYARAKRGGELAATATFDDRALLLRAGLILGPHEDLGRLPWWLDRVARGGDVLAPGPPDLSLQYVDARDLARWGLAAVEQGLSGPIDTVSPSGHASMRELLEACVATTGSAARLRWVDPDVVTDAGIAPWTQLPIWMPPGELHDSLHRSDASAATAAGLTCRPVTETVVDTWRWLQRAGGPPPTRPDRPAVGLDPEVEGQVLARVRDGS